MADALISKIKLGANGTVYEISDAKAREDIKNLQAVKHFVGTTTTQLVDGSTTNPITVGEDSITAISGNVTIYGKKEFLFGDDNQWHEFGDVSSLKALAYKDEVTSLYTPDGKVTLPDLKTEELTSTGSVDIPTSVDTPAFKGTKDQAVSVSGTPDAEVTISAAAVPQDGTATYTPDGKITVTPTPVTIKQVATTGTLPELTTSVSDETLTIDFNQGALATTADAEVLSSVSASFTGTGTLLNAKYEGKDSTFTGTFTPEGTIDPINLTTTATEISVTGTPAVSYDGEAGFQGTPATITSK